MLDVVYIGYNYKGAAALWAEYFNTICDPWTLGDTEKQQERRQFMYNLTRKTDIELYTDYIREQIEEMRPVEGAKSRCFDFDLERQYQKIIDKINSFHRYRIRCEVTNHDRK